MISAISVDELAALVKNGMADPVVPGGHAHVFDVRAPEAFAAGCVPGAMHLPPEAVVRWAPQRVSTLELLVVVDENGAVGGRARQVAAKLAHRWFGRVRVLAGGWNAWIAAGGAAERGEPAGAIAGSFDGARPEFRRSATVPWRTTPGPARVP